MSKDPEKKSKKEQRQDRAARLAKFTPVDNERVARAIRVNESFVPGNATVGPGLNNIYADFVDPKKVDVDLTKKK
jgi:hypothetical protein